MEIQKYYDSIAKTYEESRFSNSYGKYVDFQENRIINKYLNTKEIRHNLDLACGTGRFLNFANYGLDISQEMVKISKGRFPNKNIFNGDAKSIPFENSFFKNIISFHLFMHLNANQFEIIVEEVSRVAKKDACFIFDIPSKRRRNITGYKANSWHGAYQITKKEIEKITSKNWNLIAYHGVAFFPIHRIPKKMRKYFISLDVFLSNSIFKEYSSHLVFILQKK